MYCGAGATIEGKLGEAISSTNVDVMTVAVDTNNVITVKTDQQLDGVVARTIVDANKGFVSEIVIKNTDTVTHSVIIQFNDGVATRGLITIPLAINSSLVFKPGTGWQVLGAYFGSGFITSGMIGNAAVLSGSIGSGQVGGSHVASGGIMSGDISDGAVVSGSIGSGQIADFHFASGAKVDSAEWMISDGLSAAEPILGAAGALCVTVNSSGGLVVAMAGQSGRFPAIGVVVDNVLSGQPARRYHKGRLFSDAINVSGARGNAFPIWLGISGELAVSNQLPGGSGLSQVMGFGVTNSGMTIEMNFIYSGTITKFCLASGCVTSGHIGSGQIGGNHIGSGGVLSAAIASGAVSTFKIASGTTVTNARWLIDDTIFTSELISGCRAVNIDTSGRARVAMAGVSGRMPAVGVVVGNVLSGRAFSTLSGTIISFIGRTAVNSGLIPTSGFGSFLYVGMSGNLVGPTGILSGMVCQRVGVNAASGVILVNVSERVTSGLETTFKGNF